MGMKNRQNVQGQTTERMQLHTLPWQTEKLVRVNFGSSKALKRLETNIHTFVLPNPNYSQSIYFGATTITCIWINTSKNFVDFVELQEFNVV